MDAAVGDPTRIYDYLCTDDTGMYYCVDYIKEKENAVNVFIPSENSSMKKVGYLSGIRPF